MIARDRIRSVTERWFLGEPLLFSVMMTHRVEPAPAVRTLRTARGVIQFNPAFIGQLTDAALQEVLRAEVLRILLRHPYQRRRESPQLSYQASNITLAEHSPSKTLALPDAATVFGETRLKHLHFERYYEELRSRQPPAQSLGADGSAEGEMQPGDLSDSAADAPAALDTWKSSALVGAENAADWDQDDLISEQIDEAVERAAAADAWGSTPGKLRERLLAMLRPKLDYRAVLRCFRASVLASTRRLTRMRPSRRYGFQSMGAVRAFTTRLLFAVDVSGSISSKDLARGFSVVHQFFRYGIDQMDVVQFDTKLQGDVEVFTRARRRLLVTGRGGTSFQPVFDYAADHPEYDGLIIFTDGMAPVPVKRRPGPPRVVWLFNTEEQWTSLAPTVRHLGLTTHLRS